jgi:hypothetical protein
VEFNLIKDGLIQSDDLFLVINYLTPPAWVEDIRFIGNKFYWDERYSMISWGETHSIELPQGEYIFVDFVTKYLIRAYFDKSDLKQSQKDYIIQNFDNKRNVFIIKYTEKYYRDLKLNRLLL